MNRRNKQTKKEHLTFVKKHDEKSFWSSSLAGSCLIRFRGGGEPQRDAGRTAVQDRSASQTDRRDSLSKIRVAPPLNDPWMSSASPHSSPLYSPTHLRPFPPSLSVLHGNANSRWLKTQPIAYRFPSCFLSASLTPTLSFMHTDLG